MNTEESLCIEAPFVSQYFVSFNLSASPFRLLDVIGFNKMKNGFYCLIANEGELQIIKINHFLQNATIMAHIRSHQMGHLARSTMSHEKDLIGVIELDYKNNSHITSSYGHIYIFHVDSGMLEEFVINNKTAPYVPQGCRSRFVPSLFSTCICAWFPLENKGWLIMADYGDVYVADIDHITNVVSWKYLTVVPNERYGPISSVLAIKEKFFCSYEQGNNVATYDGRNNIWSVTYVGYTWNMLSPFYLHTSSHLVCFSDEPMFVVSKWAHFPNLPKAYLFQKDENDEPLYHHICQHLAEGIVVSIFVDHTYVDLKALDVFYNNVQSLQDLAFKTVSVYSHSHFKSTNETFKSMLNLSCSLNRKYF